ncbi:hypothetical protein BC941DRAFT_428918 [Chlamydoabsidia padenii]|nr:hypothetical protein BC941DRAFT_428918 [Chlamydoabsidia padenii]
MGLTARNLNSCQQQMSFIKKPDIEPLEQQPCTVPPLLELAPFDFKQHGNDIGLEHKAKNGQETYGDLEQDQLFLYNLKRLWENKLDELQVEKHYLEKMYQYSQQDLNTALTNSTQPPQQEQLQTQQEKSTPKQPQKRKRKQTEGQSQTKQQPQKKKNKLQLTYSYQSTDHRQVGYEQDDGGSVPWSPIMSSPSSGYLTADDIYWDGGDDLFDSIDNSQMNCSLDDGGSISPFTIMSPSSSEYLTADDIYSDGGDDLFDSIPTTQHDDLNSPESNTHSIMDLHLLD